MEGEGAAEGGHVVVAASAGVVGGVDAYAEVAAYDHHAEVETEPDAGAEGEVAQEGGGAELAAGAVGIVLEQPHVARIDEYGTVERSGDWEAEFHVGFEFECAGLVEVVAAGGFGRAVAAGAYGTYGEGSDGVGSSYPELFAVGDLGGVAVGVGGSDGHAAHEPVGSVAYAVAVDDLC